MRTLFPILLTFSIYLVFYTGIESKPSNPGFWMILAMGMSIGLALKTFFQWIKSKK